MVLFNGSKIETFKFPNGELGISPDSVNIITKYDQQYAHKYVLKFENNDDIFTLAMVKSIDNHPECFLTITYMPYSRQDRLDIGLFELKYVANMINAMNFKKVTILEPHSDVAPALIDRVEIRWLVPKMFEDLAEYGDFREATDYIFYPDTGAYKRYSKKIPMPSNRVLIGAKMREPDGTIAGLSVYGTQNLNGAPVMIVDDLCSRGGTFLEAAKKLKALNAGDIKLLVAHCENTIFSGELLDSGLIKKIYTTDSIPKEVPKNYKNIINICVI